MSALLDETIQNSQPLPAKTTEREKGRTIWEKSVVIALRDAQWRNARKDEVEIPSAYPEEHISLAGKTEEKLGDAILRSNDLLFLYEIKATQRNISSEWRKGREKPAHSKLMDEVKKLAANPRDNDARNNILNSVQCHHFAYWHHTRRAGLTNISHLRVEPYLLATLRIKLRKNSHKDEYKCLLEAIGHCRVLPSKDWDPKDPNLSSSVSIDQAIEGQAVISHKIINGFGEPLPLGLRPLEFASYVRFLCSNEYGELVGDYSINAVVQTAKGEFFILATDIRLLDAALTPSNLEPEANGHSGTGFNSARTNK